MNPASCVVLVPAAGAIAPECERGLRVLEARGYPVRRVDDGQTNDVARARMAHEALAAGFDELMWIDRDIVFDPDDVEKLRRHNLPLVCGIYPKVRSRQLSCAFLPGTDQVAFGQGGGLLEIRHGAFGFMLTRRSVFDAIQRRLALPECNQQVGATVVPWFMPLLVENGPAGSIYLTDDFAFCERVRQCELQVMADSSVRLWQMGRYAFGWEDAGSDKPEYSSFLFHLTPPAEASVVQAAPQPESQPASQPEPPPTERNLRSNPPRGGLGEPIGSRRPDFPRLKAYVVSYPANHESLQETLRSYRRSDWGEEPQVFLQPADWPVGTPSAAANYKRALEAALADDSDFAVISEDDVRVGRRLRRNLSAISLLRRDQCDYLSLFMPDLIRSPWEREERHLGYRLAKPLYSGPNDHWEKHRIWGAQTYVLSRRLIRAALERWDRLTESQDTRVISVCSELQIPLWYSAPCLVQHAPLRSAFATPTAYAPDFDDDFAFRPGAGYQPPEAIPGWLTVDEGRTLWELAAGRDVLELGTTAGRATVCLAQQSRRLVSVDPLDQSEAREWVGRYGLADRVEFLRAEIPDGCPTLRGRFDLVVLDTEHDAESLRRDLDAALPLLRRGALLAVHDYPDPGWPAVRLVVDEYAQRLGWQRQRQVDYLGVFRT